MSIDTDSFSSVLRERGIDRDARLILISNLQGSEQADDLSEPPNCAGFGRIRHFRRSTAPGWPENPLPIDPAAAALGLPRDGMMRAQVFQNAVCNWRCWYCYVDFPLLSGNSEHASLLTATDLLDLMSSEEDPPALLDLSGGQPDLVPEWVVWVAEEIDRRGLGEQLYLWSDDNLSNDYFWTRLAPEERSILSARHTYGKVCCFKGFDDRSFSFNTDAAPELFSRQFELFGRLLAESDIDLYAYATFTSPEGNGLAAHMSAFVERLQELDPVLPLRLIPLRVEDFTPARGRMGPEHRRALAVQEEAIGHWQDELAARFSAAELEAPITEIELRRG